MPRPHPDYPRESYFEQKGVYDGFTGSEATVPEFDRGMVVRAFDRPNENFDRLEDHEERIETLETTE